MTEPEITINGVRLNDAQALALRVAINSLAMEMLTEGLGDDEHGRFMSAAYLERTKEIVRLMRDGE